MPVVSMMRMEGSADALAGAAEGRLSELTERLGPGHGWLGTVVARDGDTGILIINLWEHEEGRHAMAEEPEIQEAMREAGLPKPKFEGYEVLSMNLRQPAIR
jgi:hypothetical protein